MWLHGRREEWERRKEGGGRRGREGGEERRGEEGGRGERREREEELSQQCVQCMYMYRTCYAHKSVHVLYIM